MKVASEAKWQKRLVKTGEASIVAVFTQIASARLAGLKRAMPARKAKASRAPNPSQPNKKEESRQVRASTPTKRELIEQSVQRPQGRGKRPGQRVPGQAAGLPTAEVSLGRASRDAIKATKAIAAGTKQQKLTHLHKH